MKTRTRKELQKITDILADIVEVLTTQAYQIDGLNVDNKTLLFDIMALEDEVDTINKKLKKAKK
jgi:hypothetical protein